VLWVYPDKQPAVELGKNIYTSCIAFLKQTGSHVGRDRAPHFLVRLSNNNRLLQ
jgi:hypothetical protein